MINRSILEQLHCPYCGSAISCRTEIQTGASGDILYGILECSCFRYPVIEGIAILRQRSAADGNRDPGVVYLEAGNCRGALDHALSNAPVPGVSSNGGIATRLARLVPVAHVTGTSELIGCTTFLEAVATCRPEAYAHYLFHRYANNSFLAAIPLFLLLKELQGRPVRFLDLNCGAGHASFLVQALFPNVSAIATDHDFVNLYMARRFVVPSQTVCLCLDAEVPLPFADASFEAMLCMDGLHYVRSKKALARELNRIGVEDGIWLFPHMHNASGKNISAGIPLTPHDYRRCFDIPLVLLDESSVLDRFMRNGALDLSHKPAGQELERVNAFSGIMSRRSDLWRNHADIVGLLTERKSQLHLNPLYCPSEEPGGGATLDMSWPSTRLQGECQAIEAYLPRQCRIDAPVWDHLQQRSLAQACVPGVEDLIRSFVFVPLPDTYA